MKPLPILAIFLFVSSISQLNLKNVFAVETVQKLVLSVIIDNRDQQQVAKVLTEAYGNLGIVIELMALPGRRALEFSDSGKTDGEVFRIRSINEKFVNLRRVPTPVVTYRGYAYSLENLNIRDWRDLVAYRIGIIRGHVWAEERTKGHRVEKYDSIEIMVDKLVRGAVDVIVETQLDTEKELKLHSPGRKFYRGEMLAEFKVYHFLHKKHSNLIEPINSELIRLLEKKRTTPQG